MKSIAFYSFNYSDAMAHLRLMGPASHAGMRVVKGYENGIVHVDRVGEADIVVMQRDFPRDYRKFRDLINYAHSLKKPVVYDLDDLLFELPEGHPDRHSMFFTSALLPMLEAVMVADLVTVSTPALKAYLLPVNENVKVLPNFFDDSLWNFRQPFPHHQGDKVVIGYMGGHTHLNDLRLILPALKSTIIRNPLSIEVKFWGIKPPEELLAFPQVSWTIPDTLNYVEFAKFFQQLAVDIWIAPLEDNLFNRCKSGIKYLEYSALGAPGIFSNVESYRQLVNHGENGLLAVTHDDWLTALNRLIEDGEYREALAKRAQHTISTNWLLSINAQLWLNAYESLNVRANRLDSGEKARERIIQVINSQLDNLHRLNDDDHRKSDEEIKKLSLLLSERESELNEIRISKTWKLASSIRNIFYVLVPSNSRRLKFFRWMYHHLKGLSVPRGKHRRLVLRSQDGLPFVSVVIPIFDRTDILIESIESVLKQSFQDFELILVCDGSPDETLEIVRSYESKDNRVRAFFFKKNSGNASRGRNKGIIEARGKFIAFQDSDDIADPDRLANSLTAFEEFDVDVVYGGWKAIVDGSREINIQHGQEVFSPDCDLDLLKTVCVPCQSTVMARTESLRAVGGVKEKMRYREDHELWLRLAYNGYKFKSVRKILTNLRLHKDNLELAFKANDEYWFNMMLNEFKHKPAMKPKIGYVIPGTGISGGIAVVCEHANRLLDRGYDISLITEDNGHAITWFPNQNVQVIPVSKVDDNYDVLVATGWATAYTVNRLTAKNKYYFVQSDESRFYSKDDPYYQKSLDTYRMDFHYLTEARWIQRWLKTEFGKDATYVPNGVNQAIFYNDKPYLKKGEKVRVLLEGPIDIPFKGMADAFEAVNDLDCEVWCISSSGKPKPEWRCDQFFHKVPIEKMRNIYSSCDILLKMSRVEGFFGPPLEMMACGGTVVVGKVTGYDEYIVDGHNALVVEMGDIQGAKEAVRRLIEDAELRNCLIENGRQTANRWKWDSTIDVLEKEFWNQDGKTP